MNHTVLLEPNLEGVAAFPRQTILIIEDDRAAADVLSRRLRQQGFDTLTAASGRQGLTVARSKQPDLVVLNLRLPDTDGFSVCRELVDAPETACVPVLLLSDLARPHIVRRCRAAGCQFFLRKPYDPNVLLVLICEAIRQNRHWQGLPS